MTGAFDKETKRYIILTALLAAALLAASLLQCFYRTDALRSALLENDRLVASSLLSQGVPQTVVAHALTNTNRTEAGEALVEGIGLDEKTAPALFPAASAARSKTVTPVIITALLGAAAVALALRFFHRREELFRQSAEILGRFVDGDYSRRLPRAREGGLYAMLSAADTLAMTLESRSEGEKRAKQGLREVISDVSHQLKTPLAALRLYVELMSDNAGDEQTVRSFTEKSALSIDRIEGLIQTLLKVMRLDTGNVEFHKEKCRVADLAANAAAELLTRAAVEGKTLKIEGDGEAELYCDPQWTAEALMNLVKNALDYTSSGGSVSVTWEQTPAMLRINVSDDGCGIAPEDMPFLFKRFYRSSNSRDIQGVGLGLPLTRSVTETQGGMISVKSEPGMGSQFTLSFLT